MLGVANLLEGAALDWSEPRLREFLNSTKDKWSDDTIHVFESYDNFERELRTVFGEIDEERMAERQLMQLRQVASAAKYTAEFRRLESKLAWDANALCAQYYAGLKDSLKDELARMERPDTLEDMIETTVRLDNRLYERKLEKGEKTTQPRKPNQRRPKAWGDPMEIDTVEKHEKRAEKKPLTSKQQEWQKTGACLKCGKKGHFARNCKTRQEYKVKQAARTAKGRNGQPTNFEIPTEKNAS